MQRIGHLPKLGLPVDDSKDRSTWYCKVHSPQARLQKLVFAKPCLQYFPCGIVMPKDSSIASPPASPTLLTLHRSYWLTFASEQIFHLISVERDWAVVEEYPSAIG